MKKETICNKHVYSRSLNAPRPRLCEICKKPESCEGCFVGNDNHMCCPVCTLRDLSKDHTCIEKRPIKTKLTKWDKRFMEQANFVASWSKDTTTKCGAVIVDDENTELVMGYNGFPRGADDNTDQRRYEKPEKYVWTEHAERNAIYKAARLGISLKNTKMYCTYFPCVDCARAIIQAGITRLYTNKPDLNHEKWGLSWLNAIIMFNECGVELIWTNEI